MSAANRGKWAESEFRKQLKALNAARANFAFHRHPDPHAGSLQTSPADFEAMSAGQHYLLEVKEVKVVAKNGSRLLPSANFAVDKVARMHKWQLAGSKCWVIVCHRPMDEWRLVPLSVFLDRRPSWQLKDYPAMTLVQVMKEIFGSKT